MAVDETGDHGFAGAVDPAGARPVGEVLGRADGDDPLAIDGHRAGLDDAPLVVDGDHRAADEQQVARLLAGGHVSP